MPLTSLIRRFEATSRLAEDQKHAIGSLPFRLAEIARNETIVREGERPVRSCFVLDGFAYSFKFANDGKRQIVSLHLAGDAPDLQGLHLDVLDFSIGALTRCRVAFVQHDVIRQLCEQQSSVAQALWRLTLIEAAVFREWITSAGQRSAISRLAHLFCELFARALVVGLATDRSMSFPLTQAELGEAVGLSTVHVNRSVQALRAENLIQLQHGSLTIHDWEGLQRVADFDSTYLHLLPKSLSLVEHIGGPPA